MSGICPRRSWPAERGLRVLLPWRSKAMSWRRSSGGAILRRLAASQLLKVLIDATVGSHQGLLRTTASVQTPKVVLVDKVVHQVVPQQKPIDLFKIKSKDKGKPEHEARLAAYYALVVTQQRAGLYSMPCAAAVLA